MEGQTLTQMLDRYLPTGGGGVGGEPGHERGGFKQVRAIQGEKMGRQRLGL